jgi:hypothetical protein
MSLGSYADLRGLSAAALNVLLLCERWLYSAFLPAIALIATYANYWRNILLNALMTALSLCLWLLGVKMSLKPIRFNATSEDLLRHEIYELALKIQSLSDQRDTLIGKSVAM